MMGFFFRNGVYMFRKTSIAVLGLAACNFAIAGTMGPVCTPGNVTVPCAANFWNLGVQALYLRSIVGVDRSLYVSDADQFKEVNNDWNWGFRLEGSYHYTSGNDISVTWMHYNRTTNQSNFAGFVFLPPPISEIAELPFGISNKNRLDQVNLVLGQHTDLGIRDKMRFYGGVQYAYIQSNISSSYILPSPISEELELSQFDNTDFMGVGPVVGIDYSYDITGGLSVTANGAGSLLWGTSHYDNGLVENSLLIYDQSYASKILIVPSLEAKLGLNYAYTMSQGVLNLEGGYQVVNYFNAIQAQFLQNVIGNITTVNYGLYGPYFGLKYVGNV